MGGWGEGTARYSQLAPTSSHCLAPHLPAVDDSRKIEAQGGAGVEQTIHLRRENGGRGYGGGGGGNK